MASIDKHTQDQIIKEKQAECNESDQLNTSMHEKL
jgi:hypothetical protein